MNFKSIHASDLGSSIKSTGEVITNELSCFKITIYSIDYSKHKDSYNFFDSEKCVSDFLLNCRYNFKNTEQSKTFKCSFTIQNQQKSRIPNALPSFDSRYWSTSPYESVFFNDFIFFSLKSEILNRVIQNGLSGSSWYF